MDPKFETVRISVALIVKNEEANLARTLESIRWADEMVVVDSGSTDGSVEIARAMGARVIEQEWLGFAAQKNFAISQCGGEWVLSLDADEAVDEELRGEIARVVSGPDGCQALYVNRKNYFLGRWIRHAGFYPDAKLRLFRKGVVWFEERAVHESMKFDGPTEKLKGNLLHYAYPTLESYFEHMNRYSSLGASEAAKNGRRAGLIADVVLRPALTFVYNYGIRLGFLDGREGLLLNLFHAFYVSSKYAKLWALGAGRTGRERP
ncbi:glycosyltransferase involved in cell wall biosynthesis [Granulicella aggregans]|uniref:Glycosyltransferase involved in cell wall biosynthesis n=1 Tax=Granulicella aggregans TaxID=474949 RepID=A0A7W7ZD39_9BACT|nr:glycosyltransferase family 2 protein [Granulicella aggregans]MBB5057714.1 glycosyltransferase involved in cell wall biosynthesis [Granulicella aggregans]